MTSTNLTSKAPKSRKVSRSLTQTSVNINLTAPSSLAVVRFAHLLREVLMTFPKITVGALERFEDPSFYTEPPRFYLPVTINTSRPTIRRISSGRTTNSRSSKTTSHELLIKAGLLSIDQQFATLTSDQPSNRFAILLETCAQLNNLLDLTSRDGMTMWALPCIQSRLRQLKALLSRSG